jgi:hypothetical protein
MAVTYLRRIREDTRVSQLRLNPQCFVGGPLQCGNYDEVQLKNDVSHKVELTNTRGLKKKTSMFEALVRITSISISLK